MDSLVLCKCSKLFLLATVVVGMQFTNASLTNEIDTAPRTVDIFHERLHSEIGVASLLSNKPGNHDLVAIVEQQIDSAPSRRLLESCQLETTCHNSMFIECNFTGCLSKTELRLENKELSGPLPTPEELYQNLPNLQKM